MSYYQAPKGTSFELLFDEIKSLSNKSKYNPILIDEDFNLHDTDWEPNPLLGITSKYSQQAIPRKLDLWNFDQLVNFTTRKNQTLDLQITNRPSFVEKYLPIPGFGDHDTAILVGVACQSKYMKSSGGRK